MRPVNVIVSCSNKKRVATPDALRLRSVRVGSVGDRLEEWLRRLSTQEAPACTAGELYGGDHWQAARGIVSDGAARGLEVRLWVSSAGYGLLRASDRIKPYSATFAPGTPDSITRSSGDIASLQAWWSGLANRGPREAGRQTVANLATREAEIPVVVIASTPYLRAMAKDLADAATALSAPELLSILSVGANAAKLPVLEPHLLPATARFEARVGGTRAALNSRVGRLLFQHIDSHSRMTSDDISSVLQKLATDLPELRQYDRRPMSDAEVRDFIEQSRAVAPTASKTRLLRELRQSGRACEQGRFSNIFAQVTGDHKDAT